MFTPKLLVIILFFLTIEGFSQIQITYPHTRIVFQRNNQNQATVNIAGSYLQQLDRIDARALPVFGGQGSATDWVVLQNTLNSGIFNGTLLLNGGWYNLELRGILNGNVVTTSTLERVGVGEVFIVSGQSNAQGDASYSGGAIGASDDRVSTINYYDATLNEDALPFQFSQMGDFTRMAPYNYVPWFWSRLGDKLVQKLNVPVLFYGAALGGLGSDAWRRSAEGVDLRQELPTFVKVPGMPYRGLKAALQQFVTRTGVRAILWQQGESDPLTPAETYFNNINVIIEKSRNDSKKGDLAWVVARSSRNPATLQNVINGQNLLIQRTSNVFNGPITDDIFGANFRADGIHFHNDGLNRAADFWSNSLDASFFNNSQPLLGREIPKVNIICNSNSTNNKFTISVENSFSKYNWNVGLTSPSFSTNSGTFSVKTQDDVGNTYYSQPFSISNNNSIVPPAINVGGPTTFCEGGYVTLSSSINSGNFWNNGDRGQTIFVFNSGTFFVTNSTINGCTTVSQQISVNVKPLPQNNIVASKPLPICPDDSLLLITNNFGNVSYLWSNNAKTQNITVKNAGNYSLKIRGENGCESQSFIDVTLRQRPIANILADGPTTFCFGKSVNVSSNGDFSSYSWSNGANSKSINVQTTSNIFLKVKDNFGCFSQQVGVNVVANALPAIKIIADGVDKFCEGNVVKLLPSLTSNLIYRWNTGENSKEIRVAKPGLYTLTVQDLNNCESKPDSINLKYIPSPIASITTAGNLNTICQGNSITLNSNNAVSYIWNTGSNSNNILIEKAGVYTLKIRDDKNCESKPVSYEVFVKNAPLKPSILIAGAYQLEALPVNLINDQIFEWKLDETNLNSTSTTLKTFNSGKYSVRNALKYTLQNNTPLFCYSPYSDPINFLIPENDNGMRVYPNPNPTGLFYIETLNDNPNASIYVYNILGSQVLFMNISDFKEKRLLDLRSLDSGVYFVRLRSSEYTGTSKIIIKN